MGREARNAGPKHSLLDESREDMEQYLWQRVQESFESIP